MRRRALLIASAASATAILGGWQLGALGAVTAPVAQGTTTVGSSGSTDAAASGTGTSSSSDSGSSATATATDAAAGTTDSASATSTSADGTYAGAAVSTRWGDVQVAVTISGGAITDVTALQLTDADGRSVQISNRAAPVLREEVLQAQSASVSMVSGATYTSGAYLESLQAALDQAGF